MRWTVVKDNRDFEVIIEECPTCFALISTDRLNAHLDRHVQFDVDSR